MVKRSENPKYNKALIPEERNVCDKIIVQKWKHVDTHKHLLNYEDWLAEYKNRPYPILPFNMLESMNFTGEELLTHCKNILRLYNVSGKMLEIGGRGIANHVSNENFWGFKYNNINIENPDNCPRTIVGDITKCDIPDNSYDFIYSMDTFEHIKEPWKAAKEIARILKPRGIVVIVTLFSWRYHPAPIDYWRFSPHCLNFLFSDLQCIEANWDIKNRRTPYQGSSPDDSDICPEDHFGPWEENWRVYYIGQKL